jgi:phage FluMu protein Com
MERDETPQIRCGNCNKLLGKGTALDLAIKCPRCGCINHVKMCAASANLESPEPHKKDAIERR